MKKDLWEFMKKEEYNGRSPYQEENIASTALINLSEESLF